MTSADALNLGLAILAALPSIISSLAQLVEAYRRPR